MFYIVARCENDMLVVINSANNTFQYVDHYDNAFEGTTYPIKNVPNEVLIGEALIIDTAGKNLRDGTQRLHTAPVVQVSARFVNASVTSSSVAE